MYIGGTNMSCCRKQVAYVPQVFPKSNNCICDLPTLIILILIVLQFSKKNHGGDDGCDEGRGHGNQVGNGILFIVALFFLSCAGCGRGNTAY